MRCQVSKDDLRAGSVRLSSYLPSRDITKLLTAAEAALGPAMLDTELEGSSERKQVRFQQ